jgi:hypothetical protein
LASQPFLNLQSTIFTRLRFSDKKFSVIIK